VTEPLRNHSGEAGDPFSVPMTCRQEVHSERGKWSAEGRSSRKPLGARGVSVDAPERLTAELRGGSAAEIQRAGSDQLRDTGAVPPDARRGDHP
jgi:hypothetical protein